LARSEHYHGHNHEVNGIFNKEVPEEQSKTDKNKPSEVPADELNEDHIGISYPYQSHQLEDLAQTALKFISGHFDQVKFSSLNPNHIAVYHPIEYCLTIDADSLEVVNKDNCGEYKRELRIFKKLGNGEKTYSSIQETETSIDNRENKGQLKQYSSTIPESNQIFNYNQEEDSKNSNLKLSHEELEKLEFKTKVEKLLSMVKNVVRTHSLYCII
jgi:hypothetical protein